MNARFTSGWRAGPNSILPTVILIGAVFEAVQSSRAASYSVTLQPGLSSIANHLNTTNGTPTNGIYLLIPIAPDGTTFYKWNNASQSYDPAELYDSGFGGWFPGTARLNPGEVAMVQNPLASPLTITFRGVAPTPNLPRDLLAEQTYGYSMQTNAVGTYEAITGRSPGLRSQMLKWNAVTQAYNTYVHSNGAWFPSTPTAAVGEGVFVVGPTNTQPCVTIFCPPDTTATSSNGLPVNVPYTVITSNYCGLGPVKIVCNPPSPGPFPVGTNQVLCVVSVTNSPTTTYDAACNFKVVVVQPPPPGAISISRGGGNVILNWAGSYTLQSATNVLGPFSDLPGLITSGPYTNAASSQQVYFRLRQ